MTAGDLLDFAVPGGEITDDGPARERLASASATSTPGCDGTGAAAIDNLMEDAATAEISRSQVWQWVRHGHVTRERVREEIDALRDEHPRRPRLFERGRALGRVRRVPHAAGVRSARGGRMILTARRPTRSRSCSRRRSSPASSRRARCCGRSSSPSGSTSAGRRSARRCAGSPRSGSSRSCPTAACACGRSRREELREAFLVRAELEIARDRARGAEDHRRGRRPSSTPRRSAFTGLTEELRARRAGRATARASRATGCARTTRFHDVIYRVADVPLIERLAKSARRTFSGPAVWAPGDSDDRRALRAERPRSTGRSARRSRRAAPTGARALAREHVLSLVRAARGDPHPGRRPPARLARGQAPRAQLIPETGLPSPGRRSGGTGRRAGLKIRCPSGRVGSIPTFGTLRAPAPAGQGGVAGE